MKPIFIIKPGSMSQEDIDKIQAEGYLLVEHSNPKEIIQIHDSEMFEGKELLGWALNALDYGNEGVCRQRFGTLIREKLKSQYPLIKE